MMQNYFPFQGEYNSARFFFFFFRVLPTQEKIIQHIYI